MDSGLLLNQSRYHLLTPAACAGGSVTLHNNARFYIVYPGIPKERSQ